MAPKKKITIEYLAEMVKRGFDETHKEMGKEINGVKQGLYDFKQEMMDFKQEMLDFKEKMTDFKLEMTDFKKEMMDFKKDMTDFGRLSIEEFDRINSNMRDIKITLGPLVRATAMHDVEIRDMRFRISRLEKRAGIGK